MSAIDGHESCDFCGEVMREEERFTLTAEDTTRLRGLVPGIGAEGEWIWFRCPHGCTEFFIRPDELLVA